MDKKETKFVDKLLKGTAKQKAFGRALIAKNKIRKSKNTPKV